MYRHLILLPASIALLASAGCSPSCETVDVPMGPGEGAGEALSLSVGGLSLTRHTVDTSACGAAFLSIADVNGDDRDDLVVSRYGKGLTPLSVPDGEITIYQNSGDLGSWDRTPMLTQADEVRFPAGSTLSDLDGDGDLDAVVGAGWFICGVIPGIAPCGNIFWLEQEEGTWTRHDIVGPADDLFFHKALLTDLDGDGNEDLLTVGERWTGRSDPGFAEIRLYFGTGGAEPFETQPHVLGQGLGTIPKLADVDGDGDIDLYGAQYFLDGASFGWLEQVRAPADSSDPGEWAYHVIDDQVGGSIDMRLIPDLFGDGVTRAIGTNHTNPLEDETDPEAGVFVYTPPTDPTQAWERTSLANGIASLPGRGSMAPGVFGWGDLEGDGDIDLAVSGDGDPRVFLFLQEEGSFTQHVLLENLSQAGGMAFSDLDGNGTTELVVTGYDADAVYVFEVAAD